MYHSLRFVSYRSFEMFKKKFASDFGIVGMHRQFWACAYKFLTTATKGVFGGIRKLVIQSSFDVTWLHKVS